MTTKDLLRPPLGSSHRIIRNYVEYLPTPSCSFVACRARTTPRGSLDT